MGKGLEILIALAKKGIYNKGVNLDVKYRAWYKGVAPRPIKLEIPGWAGENHDHKDGAKPQPWHCPPFVDGSTYGLELVYPFDTTGYVKNANGKLVFEGDFEQESQECGVKLPPFMNFAPGHFGFTSSLDIVPPPGYVVRLEPHPRFYTDTTGEVPCAVAGHIQGEWWPKIFFVVFKQPLPGQTLVFRKGEPYAQILIVPRKVQYTVQEMTADEKHKRLEYEQQIERLAAGFIKNKFVDHVGNPFNDRYKQLSGAFAKGGIQGIRTLLEKSQQKLDGKILNSKSRLPRKLLLKKAHESIQTDQATTPTSLYSADHECQPTTPETISAPIVHEED